MRARWRPHVKSLSSRVGRPGPPAAHPLGPKASRPSPPEGASRLGVARAFIIALPRTPGWAADPFWILLLLASCLTHSEASLRHHLRASYRWAYPRKRSRRSPFGVPRGAWGWGQGFIRRGEARLAPSDAQAEHDQECDCFHGNSTLLGTRTRYDRAIKWISSRRTEW